MLDDAEKKIETGIGDLKKAEDKVDAAAKAKEDAEKQGLKSIVTMYETMKPKDAARVFDRLGHDVLVPLVVAMNPRKMAEILAVMSPDAAERLTVALANRARGGSAQVQAQRALLLCRRASFRLSIRALCASAVTHALSVHASLPWSFVFASFLPGAA